MEENNKELDNKQLEEYRLVKVPTGEALMYMSPNGEYLTTETAILEILNKIDKIEKAVA